VKEGEAGSVKRADYEPPMIARVHLDPVQEMLQSCPPDQGGKDPGSCQKVGGGARSFS
jgi:hypothetical protein